MTTLKSNIKNKKEKTCTAKHARIIPLIFYFLFVVFNIIGCGNLPQGRYGQEAVKIAVMPAYSTAAMSARFLPLLDRLSKETGYDVQYISAENIASFGASIENSGAQFVICDPLAVLTLIKTKNAVPLAIAKHASGSTGTSGLIVTPISNFQRGIDEISKLRARTVCCGSRESAEGFVSQAELLASNGIDPEGGVRVVAVGQMDRVLAALKSGRYAAGFIPGTMWNDSISGCYKILGEGPKVPNWALVSLQGGHTEIDEKVREALLSLDPLKTDDRKVLSGLGIDSFVAANINEFGDFSKLADRLNIPY